MEIWIGLQLFFEWIYIKKSVRNGRPRELQNRHVFATFCNAAPGGGPGEQMMLKWLPNGTKMSAKHH